MTPPSVRPYHLSCINDDLSSPHLFLPPASPGSYLSPSSYGLLTTFFTRVFPAAGIAHPTPNDSIPRQLHEQAKETRTFRGG